MEKIEFKTLKNDRKYNVTIIDYEIIFKELIQVTAKYKNLKAKTVVVINEETSKPTIRFYHKGVISAQSINFTDIELPDEVYNIIRKNLGLIN